ncbi:MAG: 30S ribosomal protein S16 [Ignavibacteria bacterium]|nr:30S ribosomal protein S16 [Ignavibacteria bacterium]NNL20248.1 30S ribosomal protein S16 [Ignavibacteriaceae bacterium]
MAVKLRLRRIGKKKQPVYKLVAADARSPRDGKFIEAVGLYNPLAEPHTFEIKEDRVLYWLNVGAQPTSTVKSLLRQKGITLKKELISKGLDEEKVNSELENWQKMKEASSTKKRVKKSAKRKKAEEQASAEKTDEVKEEPKTEVQAEEKPAEEPKVDAKEEGSTAEENSAASEEK